MQKKGDAPMEQFCRFYLLQRECPDGANNKCNGIKINSVADN